MVPSQATPAGETLAVRVYYEDTDAGGVVFYANYLKFMERARTEWLRRLGVNQAEYARETGAVFVVREVSIQYRRSARLDDLLTIRSRITRIGGASVDFFQEVLRGTELLATSTTQVCCVNVDTMRPMPVPEPLRSTLLTFISE
ncbi:tol-pal system-associated acyl-CoA thioesterase [Kerstersia gyiorum]|uniref:tol-pal system-associated acyl-CoA thioesterase n=1 Tax=Kerstersia gyiorum TaxID=206506 RepID=UPI00264630E6|nr:tol-pal system-associated acyl-CoA thioesterase [Kerstersia gyiorum]MCP1633949.1 acyl-CoA thioester hydrolase [Kerstersia gyiorum]MCP1683285.1 acyl-CoA thioester hydrolase [Kerstersia gyiorum]MCP1718955.1 acyl-CoA thioester hydrolase [Kerstersia gyiorum]MCW2187970.1 acyl-CoA thioester hydrolase [Kerstersia gyiorum]